MKRLHSTAIRITLTTMLLAVAFAACENPFQVGLGDQVDIDRPDGEIRSPDSGQYLRGVVTLTGSHSDDSSSLPTVKVSTDDGSSFSSASVDAEGWSLALDTTLLADGELELLVVITDASGKQTEKRQLYYVDNTAPLVLVKNPQGYASGSFNGTVTVRGEVADMFAISGVAVQIQDSAGTALTGFESADGTNSWVFQFDSRIYADPAGDLRLAVQATDRAGNISTTVLHYDNVLTANGNFAVSVEDLLRIRSGLSVSGVTISQDQITNVPTDTPAGVVLQSVPVSIDNDLDKPMVTIVSPANAQSVGGAVLVTGTAYDDDALDFVEMRVDLNGDGDYNDAFDLNGNGTTLDDFENESNWVVLPGTVVWAQDLNGDGELYQVEPGHSGQITIQVRAWDTKGGSEAAVAGNISQVSIVLDDSLPRVEGLLVDGEPYANGLSVSGTNVVLSTRLTQTSPPDFDGGIRDDTQVDLIRISYDGGVSYQDIYRRSTSFNDGSVTESAPNDFRFSKSIDTTNIPGVGPITSGTLYLRLLVFDNNDPVPYQTLSYLTLNVDNVYPTGSWDPSVDSMEIDGASALVQGIAEDTGAVSGVSEIQVYFVRAGQVYDLSSFNSTAPVVNTDFGDGNGPVSYTPANGTDNNPPYYHISIDNTLEFGNDASGGGDGDTFDEDLSLSGSTYNWSAQFDSTRIPDGPIELHYVVFDEAGNGTHSQRTAFIKNHRPSITMLRVGTDLDSDGTVEAGERFAYDSAFTARDLVYVEVTATDAGGLDPGIAGYQIVRAADGSTVQSTAAGTIDISSLPESTGPGDTETFTVTVTDNDGIQTSTSFSVRVDNDDEIAPTVTLDPISTASVVDGHVESAPESRFDNGAVDGDGTDDDADVSGVISLTGAVTDNQLIESLLVRITGYNAGSGPGAVHEIAAWNAGSGALEPTAGSNLVVMSEELSPDGHSVLFRYEWDSSEIAGVAAPDVVVEFLAQDFRPGSPPMVTAQLQVDVVPYITKLSTKASGVKDLIVRSASGDYSVAQGIPAAIDVFGYNLAPGGGDVWISSDRDGLTDIDQLTVGPAVDPLASFAVSSDAATSGFLNVRTGGVAATNNINNNALWQNREHSSFMNNSLWTDDRVIQLFDVNDTGLADAYFATMIMNGDAPEYAYIDDSAAADQLYRRGRGDGSFDTGLLRGIGFVQSGFTRDEGGHSYQVTLHDMTQGHMVFIFNDYTTDAGIGATQPFWNYYNSDFDRQDNNNALRLDSLALGGTEKMNRYQRPKMVTTGNADTTANVAMAWYDVVDGALYVRNFQIGTTVSNQQRSLAGMFRTNLPENDDAALAARRWAVTDPGAGEGASTDFQIAFTDDNVLVVVYYDESDGTLKLRYSTTTDDGATAASLTGADPASEIFFSSPVSLTSIYNGSYVSMAMETDGDPLTADPIHLAYYDSANADLKYTLLDSYTDTTPQTVTVDSNFSVGIWTDIAVDPASGKPVISYYNNSENGTRDSIRLAIYNGSMATIESGVDGDNEVTGSWETYTVPTNSVPKGGIPEFQKTHVGFNTSGDIVVSYLGDDLEYVRWVD